MARSETRTLSGTIIRALAETEAVDPADLDFLLYDYIDVDAIEALTRRETGEWSLDFTVADHTVTVTSDRSIIVDGTEFR